MQIRALRETEKSLKTESRKGKSLVDFTDYDRYQGLVDRISADYVFGTDVVVLRYYKSVGGAMVEIPQSTLDAQLRDKIVSETQASVLSKAINRLRLDKTTAFTALTTEQRSVGKMTKKEWSLCASHRLQEGEDFRKAASKTAAKAAGSAAAEADPKAGQSPAEEESKPQSL